MLHPRNYFHFYLGTNTNLGKLVGVKFDSCITENEAGELVETMFTEDFPLKLHLRTLKQLTEEESRELIRKGLSIGRPRGYSFSPEAFIFLLSCHVDIFGLIENRLAISLNQ